jgi:hypothetical protein
MKISKQRILQIIKEEVEDATKLKSTSLGQSAHKKSALAGVEAGEEFTAQERSIVDQIQNFVTQIASTPGVDLPRYKSALERALKYLQKAVNIKDQTSNVGEEQ